MSGKTLFFCYFRGILVALLNSNLRYVKTRSDTVKKIIQFITVEKPGESSNTFAQLVDREKMVNVNDEYAIMLDEAENGRWSRWEPDPYDANPSK
jgi:hypothetical protein